MTRQSQNHNESKSGHPPERRKFIQYDLDNLTRLNKCNFRTRPNTAA